MVVAGVLDADVVCGAGEVDATGEGVGGGGSASGCAPAVTNRPEVRTSPEMPAPASVQRIRLLMSG
ncbi:hypothetical protein GCM10023192_64860 [Amycolatopsis samaneae]